MVSQRLDPTFTVALVPAIEYSSSDAELSSVRLADDFEEITTLLAGKRSEAQIIEDEQIDPRLRLEEPRIASVERKSFEQPRLASDLVESAARRLDLIGTS